MIRYIIYCIENRMTFHYQHIGHMQFSILTMKCLECLYGRTNSTGEPVRFDDYTNFLLERGFRHRQSVIEIQRLCYGYLAVESDHEYGHVYRGTTLGVQYMKSLMRYGNKQRSLIGVLFKKSKRKGCYNVTLQETSLWGKGMYSCIEKHGFRRGPARDFLKCLDINSISGFINDACECLSIDEPIDSSSIRDITDIISKDGKYWSSVGSKYAWFAFPQYYQLSYSRANWDRYRELIDYMIRPPEWGESNTMTRDGIIGAIGGDALSAFLRDGIVRRNWINNSHSEIYQLTAPGYLMWERKNSGPIHEIMIYRRGMNDYAIYACNSSDIKYPNDLFLMRDELPTFFRASSKKGTVEIVNKMLCSDPANESRLFN